MTRKSLLGKNERRAVKIAADIAAEESLGSTLSERDSKRRNLIVNGNMWKVVLIISLPLMGINALTFLYNIIDSMMAAKIGSTAISTVVVLSQINNMLAAIGTSLASGGMIIIARLIGRSDIKGARKVANTLMCLAVIVSLVTIAIIIPLAAPILRLMRTPESFIETGTGYFSLQIVTTGVMLINNVFFGLEKSRGNTRNILLLNVAVMLIKILLSYLFIYVFNFGLFMVAASTLIANGMLTVYVVVRVLMPKYVFRFRLRNASLRRKFLTPIIVLAFPIFLGRFVFSLGKVIINSMCNHYGEKVVGALGISNNMGGYVTNVLGSVEESTSLIISTNLGKGNQERALKAFYCSFAIIMGISLFGVLLLTLLNDPIVNFYAKGDRAYANMITDIFKYEKMGIVALGVNSSLLGLLYGFGYTRVSAIINLSRLFVFRIPTLYLLMTFSKLGSESVGIAMMVSNIGIGLMSLVIGFIYLKKIKRKNIIDEMKVGEENLQNLNRKNQPRTMRKLRILQFGEGNFLRAFADWIIQRMNEKEVFEGNIAVIQPVETGRIAELKESDGLYTLYLEGIENKEAVSRHEIIDVISSFNNPYTDYGAFLNYACNPEIDIIISNTTEAGIVLDKTDTDFTVCPKSFPGKLLALMFKRYKCFNGDYGKGYAVIPCELIDNNGSELKKVLNELSVICGLEEAFIKWLNGANHFTDTLVDRIVPGYPKADIEKIREQCGYIDNNVVKGEVFHLWVLKKEEHIQKLFPADKAGLEVIFADDITPYKQRKVKILNGSHTALVPVAYLSGFDTVGESVNDGLINGFVKRLVFEEINPTINLPADQMKAFADSVLERYGNPYIRHELMSIALNSTTKFRTRLLPTLTDYIKIKKSLPKSLLFAFAAFVMFHKGKRGEKDIALSDDALYLAMWKDVWTTYGNDLPALIKEVSGREDVWGTDLSKLHKDFVKTASRYLADIEKDGAYKALEKFMERV